MVKQMFRDIIPGLRVAKGVDEILKEAGCELDKLGGFHGYDWGQ